MLFVIPPKVFQRILLGSKLALPLVLLSLLLSYSLLLPFLLLVVVVAGLFSFLVPIHVPSRRSVRGGLSLLLLLLWHTIPRIGAVRETGRTIAKFWRKYTARLFCYCGTVVVVVAVIGASSHVHGFHRTPPGWKRQWVVVCCGESRSFGLLLLLLKGHHVHRGHPSSTRIVHEDRARNVHRLLLMLMIERVRCVSRPRNTKGTTIITAAGSRRQTLQVEPVRRHVTRGGPQRHVHDFALLLLLWHLLVSCACVNNLSMLYWVYYRRSSCDEYIIRGRFPVCSIAPLMRRSQVSYRQRSFVNEENRGFLVLSEGNMTK